MKQRWYKRVIANRRTLVPGVLIVVIAAWPVLAVLVFTSETAQTQETESARSAELMARLYRT